MGLRFFTALRINAFLPLKILDLLPKTVYNANPSKISYTEVSHADNRKSF